MVTNERSCGGLMERHGRIIIPSFCVQDSGSV